jgi:short-subunit dehydrogenase
MTNNKSILITGASSGIGKYATEVFALRGWIVWAGYRDEKIKEELLKIHANVRPLKIDVTDMDLIIKSKEAIEKSGIQLNILFNNAGLAFGGPIEVLDIEEVKKVYDVNFFGYLRMIQTFLPLLRKSHGRILNMSSLAGLVGVPFLMPYSSSKFAIEGMSDGLRRELLSQKISVSVIEPGPIKTGIWEKSLVSSKEFLKNKSGITTLYEPAVGNFVSLLHKNDSFSVSQKKLKKALIHACENSHPRLRYLVYKNNYVLKFLIQITPNRLLDFLFRKVLKY